MSGEGTVRALGGNSGGGHRGAGGGGRIAVKLSVGEGFDNVRFQAYGGGAGTNAAAGTIYLEHAGHNGGPGDLVVNNGNIYSRTFTGLDPGGSVLHDDFASITIENRGNLGIRDIDTLDFAQAGNITGDGSGFLTVSDTAGVTFPAAFTLSADYTLCLDTPVEAAGNWTIPGGAVLSHNANYNETSLDGQPRKLDLTLHGDLTIENGGSINVNSRGYHFEQGPGAPGMGNRGGSHGGRSAPDCPKTYGSPIHPTDLGSGGQSNSGPGGGAVLLDIRGTLEIAGEAPITANGHTGANRAGAGGTINIIADVLEGEGEIRVRGGNTNRDYGAGGGGRIAVRLHQGNEFGGVEFDARGGSGGGNAAAGTVYKQHAGHAEGSGRLIVENPYSTPEGVVTDMPPALDTELYVVELKTVTLVIRNAGKVGLTDDITVGDLILE